MTDFKVSTVASYSILIDALIIYLKFKFFLLQKKLLGGPVEVPHDFPVFVLAFFCHHCSRMSTLLPPFHLDVNVIENNA